MGSALHGHQASHLGAVDTLAHELDLPVERVQAAYLEEISKLEASARIKNFVGVIALGTVRTELRRQQRSTG